jgi:putative ABC transport system permease protein
LRRIDGFADPDAAPLVAFAALLMEAVFVVLWIACLNFAGVLIARAASRRREIVTRLAIGAGRGRLMRRLLVEALLLARLGTLAGLALHWFLTRLLNRLSLPLPVPIVFQIAPDIGLVLYAIALTAIAALLSGLVPAWQATRPGLTAGLKMEEPQYGYRRFTFRNGLIVGQVAITMVLLSVGLLFARSLARVHSIDPGFRSAAYGLGKGERPQRTVRQGTDLSLRNAVVGDRKRRARRAVRRAGERSAF